jgi:hypothetical protein
MKWIHVLDRLPKIHEVNLLYISPIENFGSNYVIGYLETDFQFYFNHFEDKMEYLPIEYITHWMKLPKPPK